MSKRDSLFREFLEFKQFEAAEKMFSPKKEEKKEEKKKWYEFDPKKFLGIYVLMIITYPFVGMVYWKLFSLLFK